jgi:hypothetical protein
MTVTLELKPEILRRVEHRAKENGKPVEDFLEELIEENVDKEGEVDPQERLWRSKWEEFKASRIDRGPPFLSNEALRRENMYED